MKGRWLWFAIVVNLLVLVALAFKYPHLMVAPGALEPEHAALATDCFACHAPLRGASADRCMTCHALADIGLRTTKGVVIKAVPAAGATRMNISFHQELTEQNCMACHSDHAGPKLTQRSRKPFSHALLRVETRTRCESCHAAPNNDIHRSLSIGCARCHKTEAWKPARFVHAALSTVELEHCESCHKAPADTLHRQIKGSCGQCHTTKAWKPATFEHDRFFVLDRDHNASCTTCHTANDYSKYTCYGCHEHTPANVRATHLDEGIRNFDNCVKCHRSADAESENEGGGGREEGDRD
jgi:Class III cytochrome C family/Cytochrome c554 and c-prime